MWNAFKVHAPLVLVVIAGFVIAGYFIRPAPPSKIRMATGAAGGAYSAFGHRYKAALAADGIDVELVETAGSLDNLRLLGNKDDSVDVAFVQGGIGEKSDHPGLVSLASLYPEPLWVFVRADKRRKPSRGLEGLRIAVGAEGSGTSVLANDLLSKLYANAAVVRVPLGGEAAAQALLAGDVDAAAYVGGISPVIRKVIAHPGIDLVPLPSAEALARLSTILSVKTLPEGIVDLKKNIPPRTVPLLSTTANLVARDDLHPAVAALLLQAAHRIHSGGDLFSAPGEFPSTRYVDFPLSDEARQFFERGPGLLQRYLPFWAANLVQRLIVLLIPVVTLLLPFIRFAPPLYRWQVRRRIYKWYDNIRDAEAIFRAENSQDGQARALAMLDTVQAEVGALKVPLGYAEQLYQLRLHISFVRQLLLEGVPAVKPAGEVIGQHSDAAL